MDNTGNVSGVQIVPTTIKEDFEAFDRLPKSLRDIINEASYRIRVVSIAENTYWHDSNHLKDGIDSGTKKNALANYGPDHPQAQ